MAMSGELLRGKVAVVAGASKGIGAATAETLARAGASVVLAARTASELNATARRIRLDGRHALAVKTDIADAAQVGQLVQRTIDDFGRMDFFINCAASLGPLGQLTWETDPDEWRETIEVNLTGVFHLSQAIIPLMLAQESGRLIFVSSPFSERVLPTASAYCAARAGQQHLVRVLAAELELTGVTVNMVYPGIVETEGLQKFRAKIFAKNRAQREASIEPRDPSELGQLLLWLCSPATARMTGELVVIEDPVVQRRLARFLNRHAVPESW
jgi:NAD(P)-dependent dehydrogenase (short-subunit alcohol dehydrogenase family)